MAVSGTHWQLECEKLEHSCGYLLTSGLWSDCIFTVGSETKQEVIQAHKLVLAMASPVFEAMLYGGLSEPNDPIISIPDIQPEIFRALLQYIYTGNINIDSLEMAGDLWYGAQKYMLPHLITKCNTYISSVLSPKNACKAYEFAHFFDYKTLIDKSIEKISTKTKEVLNDSSFEDVELNTVITVCSLDHLNVDSELDLFNAVARYAKAEQRRQGQISPREEGGSPPEELSDKVLQSDDSCSEASPAAEEVVISEPIADKDNLKKEPTIRTALQKIRFLSLSVQQFAEGPARSDLLTQDESFKIFMNMGSRDRTVPLPSGFSECRERRKPRSDSKDQSFEACCLEHIINALKCGDPSRVKQAAAAAVKILNTPCDIQPALDKEILDALIPALTEGDDECKNKAAHAIANLCFHGSPKQLSVLAVSTALQPYCRLMKAGGHTRQCVLFGLTHLLKKVEQNTIVGLLPKLREIGVPQLLLTAQQDDYRINDKKESNREFANKLLQTYFSGEQSNMYILTEDKNGIKL